MASTVLLANVVGLVAVVAHIWLTVVAFKRSVVWGLLVLFLSPITAIIFAIKFWDDSKKPFLTYAGSIVVCVALFVYAIGQLGLFGMVSMVKGLESGELSEEDAQKFMLETMDRWEDSGMLSDEDRAGLREMRKMMAEEMEGESATSPPVGASSYSQAEAPSTGDPLTPIDRAAMFAAPPDSWDESGERQRPRVARGPIPLQEAEDYIGEFVTVMTNDGLDHRGTLSQIDRASVTLERYLSSGTIAYEIPRRDIASIELRRR